VNIYFFQKVVKITFVFVLLFFLHFTSSAKKKKLYVLRENYFI